MRLGISTHRLKHASSLGINDLCVGARASVPYRGACHCSCPSGSAQLHTASGDGASVADNIGVIGGVGQPGGKDGLVAVHCWLGRLVHLHPSRRSCGLDLGLRNVLLPACCATCGEAAPEACGAGVLDHMQCGRLACARLWRHLVRSTPSPCPRTLETLPLASWPSSSWWPSSHEPAAPR